MKKKYVLKKWVKVVLISIPLLIMFYLVFRITPKQEKMFKYCMDQGYSREYCEKGLLGY